MNYPEQVETIDELFDAGLVESMVRQKVGDTIDWGEGDCYVVTFVDGTTRRFYDSDELINFANNWLNFHNTKN